MRLSAQAHWLQHGFGLFPRLGQGWRGARKQCAGGNIVQCRHLRKRLHDLVRAGETQAGYLERLQARNRAAVEIDAASCLDRAGHRIDEGGLARPVWADETENFSRLSAEREIVERAEPAKTHRQALYLQQRAHANLRRKRRPNSPRGTNMAITTTSAPNIAEWTDRKLAHTVCSRIMKSVAPRMGPATVPAPPSIAMMIGFTDRRMSKTSLGSM